MGPPAPFDASGVFETLRVARGKILHLREHLARLHASAQTVGMAGWDEAAVRLELARTASEIKEGYVRVALRRVGEPRIVVHRSAGLPYPKGLAKNGISIRTVPSRWPMAETAIGQAKLSERLTGVLARLEAPEEFELLRMGPHGYLTEGTVSNLFLVKDGALCTAPTWLGVLGGVTRAQVIRTARKNRVPVREIPSTRHDLFNADEAFLTNVLIGILPIRQVDGRRIGSQLPGPITRRLMREQAIRRKDGRLVANRNGEQVGGRGGG